MLLKCALVVFAVAILAATFGLGGIAAGAVELAKVLFFVFLAIFVIAVITGLFRERQPHI